VKGEKKKFNNKLERQQYHKQDLPQNVTNLTYLPEEQYQNNPKMTGTQQNLTLKP